MLDNQDSPHEIAEAMHAIASAPTPPGPELADLIAEDQAGTEHADLLADDELLDKLGGANPGNAAAGDERLVEALRGWRNDVDAVPIPDSCADCGALAHRPHREDCPTLLHEPLPDAPVTPGAPPDEVTARWGRHAGDPIPIVYGSGGQIHLCEMRLSLDVGAQLADRILTAVAYQRAVTR